MSVVSILLLVLGIWMATRWRTQPDYWTQNREFLSQTDPSQVAELAQNAESRLVNGVASVRMGSDVAIELPLTEINAWLSQRLGEWLAHQQVELPREVKDFMISCEDHRLVLAFEFDSPGGKQVVSLVMTPAILVNGEAMLKLDTIRAGTLPVKAEWIESHLPKGTNRDDAVNIADLIKGKRFTPVFNHPVDRRFQIRVTGLKLHANSVELTVRGEPANR